MNTGFNSETSISKNLSVSLVLVLVGVIATAVIAHGVMVTRHDRRDLAKTADELIVNLQKSVELPLWNFDRESLQKIIDAYFLSNLVAEITIVDGLSREVLIQRKNPEETDLIIREGEVRHQNDVIANVRIGLTRRYHAEALKRQISFYAAMAVVLIVIFTWVTGILLRVYLKNPFETVIHGLDRISEGDYTHRLDQVRHKEFAAIVKRFESMADQIQEREKSLNRAKTYISNIFNSIDSILVGVDDQGCITHWNRSAGEYTGKTLEQALGKSFREMLPDFIQQADLIDQALATQTLQKDLMIKVPVKSGTCYFTMVVAPLTSEGERGAVVRISDISERVHLEEMMVQTEKMLSVGGLAAGMAHEINNPLAGMLQNSQVIENRLSSEFIPGNIQAAREVGVSMDVIKSYMEKRGIIDLVRAVRDAGNRAARIVENMLSFSRKSSSAFVASDLRDVADNTLELAINDYDLKKNYDFRDIRIIREYAAEMPPVLCDVTQIQQVILNLLKNGAYAMSEMTGASVQPCFYIRIQRERESAVIQIEDNGPGMDEETRKRVLEPFFTTKPVGIGTGLGLSVSYFIITENHKGSMAVESSPGNGACFTIKIPIEGSKRPS